MSGRIFDRTNDYIDITDYGAKLDGTTEDGPAVGKAMLALVPNQSIFFPAGSGNMKLTWGQAQGTTPAAGVLFRVDGTTNGGARMNHHFNRQHMGDLFETFYNGTKYMSAIDCFADQTAVLQIDQGQIVAGGTGGSINTVLRINTADNVGALTSTWGVHVQQDTFANAQGSWPQNVGVSATQRKKGTAWATAFHGTATDYQNLPSSTGGTMLGMEIGYHTSDVDDAVNLGAFGGVGTRMGFHLSLTDALSVLGTGTIPAEISFGILADGTANSIVKSVFAASIATNTYQVLDTRGALAPAGYANPVAAVRMLHDQIIDFDGGPALNSGPGSYLQHTVGPARLRYVSGGNELFSINDTGGLSLGLTNATSTAIQIGGTRYTAGVSTANATLTAAAFRMSMEQFISFTNADNRTLKFTSGTPTNRLAYAVAGTEMFSIADNGSLVMKVPTNATSDAAAATAGVIVGGIYRNGSALQVRVA